MLDIISDIGIPMESLHLNTYASHLSYISIRL